MKNKHYDKKMHRLIAILNQLDKARFVKTRDLAEEFNTDIRTIQRDIALLNVAGFPLVGEDGKYSFYEGFSLKKIKVTPEEKYLLTLLCGIFSGANGPLQEFSRNLLNKVLVESNNKEAGDIDLADRKRVIIERQIGDFSKKIQVYCQDEPYAKSFEKELDNFVLQLNKVSDEIKKKEGVDIRVERVLDHEAPFLFCSIFIPMDYIKIPEGGMLSVGKDREPYKINLLRGTPDTVWNQFRVEARMTLTYKFYGPFLEPKQFTCFDGLMQRFGFPMDRKHVSYDYSYGNAEFLLSCLTFYWDKKIEIPEEEKKAAGRKKVWGFKAGKVEIF